MSVANQLSPATQFGHPSFPDGRRIRSLGSEELNECLIAESLTDASPYSERQGSMIPGNHKLTGNGLLGQMTLGSLARLPNRIAHDKGRYHSQTVIEDLEDCPETGFGEVKIGEGYSEVIWVDKARPATTDCDLRVDIANPPYGMPCLPHASGWQFAFF